MAIDKITADGIADNAIGTSKIGADVIVAEDIAANAITVSEIQDNAVTTAKILDANITHAKLHNTMDLTGKTVTLPAITGNLDVTGIVDSNERTLLVTTTISNVTSVDFNSTYITDTYNTYDVVFNNVKPVNNVVRLRARMGESDTAITSSGYSWIMQMRGSKANDSNQNYYNYDNVENYMAVTPNDNNFGLGNGSSENFNCHMRFRNLREINLAKGFEVLSGVWRTGNLFGVGNYWATWTQGIGWNFENKPNKKDFITFYLSSGNFASGTVKLFGLNL